MKLTFFTMRFPVASETFVLNQVTHFIDAGYDVEIISVFPGIWSTGMARLMSTAWQQKRTTCCQKKKCR